MSELAVQTKKTAAITPFQDMAGKLKRMIVNGHKLTDDEVFALAQYSTANQLNPFAGECYYLPGTGPVPGIAGWRTKAQEQMQWEAQQNGELSSHYWVEFVEVKPGEAMFEPSKGDIAYKCILRDWITNKKWRREFFDTVRQIESLESMKSKNAFDEAIKLVGKEPTWEGIGVVKGGENFGPSEKFDRHERAKKRAEKLALRKRFPRVHLPEPEHVEGGDYEEPNFTIEVSTHTEADNMKALGYDNTTSEPSKTIKPDVKVTVPPANQGPKPALGGVYGSRTPEQVKAWIIAETKKYPIDKEITPEKRGLVVSCIEQAFATGDAKERRHAVQKYLTGHHSASEIHGVELIAMYLWLKPSKDETTGEWSASPEAIKEIGSIYAETLRANGMQETLIPQ